MNDGPPITSAAHRPNPWASKWAAMRAAPASLSERESGAGKDSITRGSALSAAKGSRSLSRQGRRTKRAVRSSAGGLTAAEGGRRRRRSRRGKVAQGIFAQQLVQGGRAPTAAPQQLGQAGQIGGVAQAARQR